MLACARCVGAISCKRSSTSLSARMKSRHPISARARCVSPRMELSSREMEMDASHDQAQKPADAEDRQAEVRYQRNHDGKGEESSSPDIEPSPDGRSQRGEAHAAEQSKHRGERNRPMQQPVEHDKREETAVIA